MKNNVPKLRRRPVLETLESRTLLAGNVTASVVNDSLMVDGDEFSNGVAIEQTSPNTFRVRTYPLGGSPTLLNGSTTTIQTFSGVTNDINVYVRAAYDEVSVNHLNGGPATIGRNLSIAGGLQATSARIQAHVGQTQGGYLLVRDAAVNISNSVVPKNMSFTFVSGVDANNINVGGQVNIRGTALSNTVALDALRAASLTIDTGNGRDLVRLASNPQVTGDVQISTGDGEDFVRIGSLSAANLAINLGRFANSTPSGGVGHVSIFGRSNIQHEVRITGSEGSDDMTIDGLHAGDAFFAWLSTGNDRLAISNSSSAAAVLRGGEGFDKLLLGSGNAFDELDQTGFE